MIKVGLTGGVGSGKTIVSQVFSLLGVPVYNADSEAKKLYESHPGVRKQMIRLLGKDIYRGHELDRRKLSGLIFQDRILLSKVNDIVHPEVAAHFLKWCGNYENHAYILQEAAILFESKASRLMDFCITVTAPVDVRIERLLERKGMTRRQALDIMDNQMQEDIKVSKSDFVIVNDNLQLVIPQVLLINSTLMKKSTHNEPVQ